MCLVSTSNSTVPCWPVGSWNRTTGACAARSHHSPGTAAPAAVTCGAKTPRRPIEGLSPREALAAIIVQHVGARIAWALAVATGRAVSITRRAACSSELRGVLGPLARHTWRSAASDYDDTVDRHEPDQ